MNKKYQSLSPIHSQSLSPLNMTGDMILSMEQLQDGKEIKELDLVKASHDSNTSWLLGNKSTPLLKKRFCGSFFCVSILLFNLLMSVIITSILIYIVIPNMIQHKFDQAVNNGLLVSHIPGSSSSIHMNLSISPITILPGQAVVAPSTLTLASTRSPASPFGTIELPEMAMDLNRNSLLSMDAKFHINSIGQMTQLIRVGEQNLMDVTTSWHLKVWGITFYPNLSLHSQVDLNSDSGRQMMTSVQKMITNNIGSSVSQTINSLT